MIRLLFGFIFHMGLLLASVNSYGFGERKFAHVLMISYYSPAKVSCPWAPDSAGWIELPFFPYFVPCFFILHPTYDTIRRTTSLTERLDSLFEVHRTCMTFGMIVGFGKEELETKKQGN